MAWVGGNSWAINLIDAGKILFGTPLIPPNIIEGIKISCDHRTVIRELDDTTPMRTASPVQAKAVRKNIRINAVQLTGVGALKNNGAVMAIMTAMTVA